MYLLDFPRYLTMRLIYTTKVKEKLVHKYHISFFPKIVLNMSLQLTHYLQVKKYLNYSTFMLYNIY